MTASSDGERVPLGSFLQSHVRVTIELGTDAHQQVILNSIEDDADPRESLELVDEDGVPTQFGRAILFRARQFEFDRGFRELNGGTYVPSGLNRLRGSSALVGRGGSALAQTNEVAVFELCTAELHTSDFLITSRHEESIALLSEWRRRKRDPVETRLGLSLGDFAHSPNLWVSVRRLMSELRAPRLFVVSGADVLMAHWLLAKLKYLRWCDQDGYPLLVRTVDGRRKLRSLLSDTRVWAVTTNCPVTALHERAMVEAGTTSRLAMSRALADEDRKPFLDGSGVGHNGLARR